MDEAIRYYQHKLDAANDLTGITYVHKLIQLEHEPTIANTLNGLKTVQYPRHFPNHLVVQLARLNRSDINDSLIEYFKLHFKATNTEWHAISALQDDRIVQTVVDAIKEYEKSYFSRKVVSRCIHLLGRIGSISAYEALREIIDDYFTTDHRFIANYEVPLASEALTALARIQHPPAQAYFRDAREIYQERIAHELATYPERLQRERTPVGIKLHEGSALDRMRQYAFPTLINWHRNHSSQIIRDFALSYLLSGLQANIRHDDSLNDIAIDYLLGCYDALEKSVNLIPFLRIIEQTDTALAIPFAWRVFMENRAQSEALKVLSIHRADVVYDDILFRFHEVEDIRLPSHNNVALMRAYIDYFGNVTRPEAEHVLIDLYDQGIPHLKMNIVEALATHAKTSDRALDFLNFVIETDLDDYITKQTTFLLVPVGERALVILIGLLSSDDHLKHYAVEALGLLRNPQAIPYLMQELLTAENDHNLVQLIIKALERIGTPASFRALNAWEQIA